MRKNEKTKQFSIIYGHYVSVLYFNAVGMEDDLKSKRLIFGPVLDYVYLRLRRRLMPIYWLQISQEMIKKRIKNQNKQTFLV